MTDKPLGHPFDDGGKGGLCVVRVQHPIGCKRKCNRRREDH